jgi:TatD DNase family protein
MFVDSHCHLEMEDYDKDRKAVIERALKDNISFMLTVGTEEKYFPKVMEIIEAHPQVYGALGIHPHNAKEYTGATERTLRKLLSHPKIVGYGEIGLDFFRNYSPRDVQIDAFKKQIELAKEVGLPLIIHSRNAEKETLEILQKANLSNHKIVIHCYSYGVETAKILLDMGCYLSVPGTVTYKKAGVAQVVRHLPLDRVLSETDAPFLTPEPKRGRRNEPGLVKLVVEEIAAIREKPVAEVAEVLRDNFTRTFLPEKVLQ